MEENFIDYYDKYGVKIAGEFFYPALAALEILNKCRINDVAMIGIDAFVHYGKKVMPRLDLIADFSSDKAEFWSDYQNSCNGNAEKFLKHINSLDEGHLLVNLALLSKKEWNRLKS